MRQHPIPQNILDIEFKLFTKFTVREFAYMAIGIGFGGIFLYLFSNGTIPAIVAFPIFLVSAGIGLFLGLVPINDQNADIFLRNYFLAITKPTQRVWKGEQFDEKVQQIAQQKGVTLSTTGTMNRDANTPSSSKVIGGTARNLPVAQFIEEETLTEIEKEEAEKLQQIEQIANQQFIMSADTTPAPLQTADAPIAVENVTQNVVSKDNEVEEITTPTPLPIISNEGPPTSKNIGVLEVPSEQHAEEVLRQRRSDEPMNRLDSIRPPNGLPQIEQLDTVRNENTFIAESEPSSVTITSETALPIATQVEDYPTNPGNIAMYLTNSDGSPIPHAMILIKDKAGAIVQAIQSDPQGLVLPNRKFQKGNYHAEIRHDNVRFPRVNFILDGKELPVVNITSIK